MSEVADRKRAGLMQAAIRVIAEDGLENTSVKDICRVSDINVAYVYRYFDNKEDLIAKTFAREDQGLLNGILNDFMLLRFNSIDYEMRCRLVFTKCWEYLMARPQELIFYVRYYYSYSFQQYSYADHIERYAGLVEKMRPAFPESVDVRMLLHYILDTILIQAERQILNPQGSNQECGERCFAMIYSAVKGSVKQETLEK